MSVTTEIRSNASPGGFQRWVKLPTDDLPLIRPPRHHMLAHITGGLTKLYKVIGENKEDPKPNDSNSPKDTAVNNGPTDAEPSEEKESKNESNETDELTNTDKTQKNTEEKEGEKETEKEKENSQNEKKDDEGGGDEKEKEEEEKKKEEDDEEEEENKKSEDKTKSKNENSASSDVEMVEEEEETTPYTDEEGEFTPEKGMPYLAGRYKYANILARGQSAIIIKVLDTFNTDKPLAIKVLHRVYKPIGSQEADILLELHRADPWLHVPFARLLNQFLYGPHYCLVFEYLSPTPLYNHYDQREIREKSSLPHVRDLTVKLLTVLGFLYKQNVIHADLKPENILLRNEDNLASIMVVDFGNALRNTEEELSLYYSDFELQTLLYRAPEVIFGMKFSLEVDMWSLGCLLAECYLGEPLFMGKSKKEILNKITTLLGPFPKEYNDGEYSKEFADFIGRPMSRYQRLENLRKRLNDCKESTFLMLVERLLTYLPDRRFTPFEAACHPFVACSTPFLYLTPSPGYIRYPTIMLDMSSYPYLPGLPDDENESEETSLSRRRLAAYSSERLVESELNSEILKDKSAADIASIKEKIIQNAAASGKTATRSDIKETLKSMGVRCEDFTISVYSREQAQSILKRQGTEVQPNNIGQKGKQIVNVPIRSSHTNKSVDAPKGRGGTINSGQNTVKSSKDKEPITTNTDDDDDDDCVILDPPDVPKPPPRPHIRTPQQFQLMGTTVQINRGAKRPNRSMMYQPMAKRSNIHSTPYYRKQHDRYGAETSVQDTLNRLKNYNISITCRKNTGGIPRGGPPFNVHSMEDEYLESDEEEDMTKYLECQIGEEMDPREQEIYDEDMSYDDDDGEEMNYNQNRYTVKRRPPIKARKSQKKKLNIPSGESDGEIPILDSSGEVQEEDLLDSSGEIQEADLLDSSIEVQEADLKGDDEKDNSSENKKNKEKEEETNDKTSENKKNKEKEEETNDKTSENKKSIEKEEETDDKTSEKSTKSDGERSDDTSSNAFKDNEKDENETLSKNTDEEVNTEKDKINEEGNSNDSKEENTSEKGELAEDTSEKGELAEDITEKDELPEDSTETEGAADQSDCDKVNELETKDKPIINGKAEKKAADDLDEEEIDDDLENELLGGDDDVAEMEEGL